MEVFVKYSGNEQKCFEISGTEECREQTERFFAENDITYHAIVYGVPYGERILVNDKKPFGLEMSIVVNTIWDVFMEAEFEVDENL